MAHIFCTLQNLNRTVETKARIPQCIIVGVFALFVCVWLIVWSYFAGRYFDEISQDTGRYCFGVDDTLNALESGAVDTLIVWENLDVTRYVLKNHSTDGRSWWKEAVIGQRNEF